MSYHDSNSEKLREKQRKVLRDSLDRQMQELNESSDTVIPLERSRTGKIRATFHNPSRRKTKTFPLTAQNRNVEPLEVSKNGQ